MDFERTLETQRLKLLRIVAGLAVLLGALAVGPVSRGFSDWVTRYVASILSRAEAAARYLVIAQARRLLVQSEQNVSQRQLSEWFARINVTEESDVSVAACRARLSALRAVLRDLPRHALRLLRRIEAEMQRLLPEPLPPLRRGAPALGWRMTAPRVERPPD